MLELRVEGRRVEPAAQGVSARVRAVRRLFAETLRANRLRAVAGFTDNIWSPTRLGAAG